MLLSDTWKDTILIVDDQTDASEALARLLSDQYDTLTCQSGDEAITTALAKQPSLILLDIQMPGIDGFETLTRMRSYSALRDTPVIFLSALDDASNESLGMQIGACDYVTKPVNLDVLRARLHYHLRGAQKLQLLQRLSYTDSLTGLLNRRALEERLETEWRGALRGGHSVSLLMLDIDRFGRYNNRYGHQKGDQCLRQVATTIDKIRKRKTDFAGRYGGEEFILALPYTDHEDALGIARQLVNDIQQLNIAHGGNRPFSVVTASIGVASYHPNHGVQTSGGFDSTHSLEALLRQADARLYEAKSMGRNQVAA